MFVCLFVSLLRERACTQAREGQREKERERERERERIPSRLHPVSSEPDAELPFF